MAQGSFPPGPLAGPLPTHHRESLAILLWITRGKPVDILWISSLHCGSRLSGRSEKVTTGEYLRPTRGGLVYQLLAEVHHYPSRPLHMRLGLGALPRNQLSQGCPGRGPHRYIYGATAVYGVELDVADDNDVARRNYVQPLGA